MTVSTSSARINLLKVADSPLSLVDIIYRSQLSWVERVLNQKYAALIENPEIHSRFKDLRARYDKRHKIRGKRFSEYWQGKMEFELDQEIEIEKTKIWQGMAESRSSIVAFNDLSLVKSDPSPYLRPTFVSKNKSIDVAEVSKACFDNPVAKDNIKNKPTSLPASTATKETQPITTEKFKSFDQKIPSNEIMQLLKNFGMTILRRIDELERNFKRYKDDPETYPTILVEDLNLLELLNDEIVKRIVNFNKHFQDVWLNRLQTLGEEKIAAELTDIDISWRNLKLHLESVGAKTSSLKRKLSDSEEMYSKYLKLDSAEVSQKSVEATQIAESIV